MSLADRARAHTDGLPATLTAQQIMGKGSSGSITVVPGFISQGVTLVVAKPKMGKSFLCLGLALGVARGDKVLGIEVEAQEVLYIALEDTERRVQARLAKMLQGAPPPGRLRFAFRWQRTDQNALMDLKNWLNRYPETRVVIIDTLAKIRSRKQGNYDADYEEISKLKAIADSRNIALVLVHHMRKAVAVDQFDLVSGSTGLTGAADSIALLHRERSNPDASLSISGRDQKDLTLALKFDNETCSWEVQEQGEGCHLTPERQEIVELLREAPHPLRLQEIAAAIGKKKSNVSNLLTSLTKQTMVTKVSYGKYQLNGRTIESCKELAKREGHVIEVR